MIPNDGLLPELVYSFVWLAVGGTVITLGALGRWLVQRVRGR